MAWPRLSTHSQAPSEPHRALSRRPRASPAARALGNPRNPQGPCAQYLGTWDLGHSNYSTGLGYVYDYWVLGPLGQNIVGVLGRYGWVPLQGAWTSRAYTSEGDQVLLKYDSDSGFLWMSLQACQHTGVIGFRVRSQMPMHARLTVKAESLPPRNPHDKCSQRVRKATLCRPLETALS